MARTEQTDNLIIATGKRKTGIARVFLYREKGEFIINDKNIDDFYTTEKEKLIWKKPFYIVGISHPGSQYRATIKVSGSGRSSQLDAVVHGLSRALAKSDEEFSKALRKAGLLTRDPRMVERKKYYFRKARKRPQYSKR